MSECLPSSLASGHVNVRRPVKLIAGTGATDRQIDRLPPCHRTVEHRRACAMEKQVATNEYVRRTRDGLRLALSILETEGRPN